MSNRPSEYLNWTTGQGSAVVAPPANLRSNGWGRSVRPPFEYANWQIWLLDQWVQYLDQITNTGTPDQVIRLINGGYWSFVASSGLMSWSANANLSIAGIPDSNNIIPAGHCTLNDGDIAYVTVNPPIAILGDITSGSAIIANVNFTGNLQAGMAITGSGIPAGTTVFGIGESTITISQNATATVLQQQLISSKTGNLTVTTMPQINFIPNLLTILIAKRLGNTVYVGVNSSQMILRDNESKPFMGSGYFNTFDIVAGQALVQGEICYISPGPLLDSGRTLGAAYPLDVSGNYNGVRDIYAGAAISNFSSGATATLCYDGFVTYSGLTPGSLYWADPSTPGGITVTKPAGVGKKIPIGFSVSANSLIVSGAHETNDLTQNLIKAEPLGTGNGTIVIYTLSQVPLDQQSIFLFVDGAIQKQSAFTWDGNLTVTLNAAPGLGQDVYAQYVLAGQTYLMGYQESPTLDGTRKIANLLGQPFSKDMTFVFVNGGLLDKSKYTLTLGATSFITLTDALEAAQDIIVAYLAAVGSTTSGGSGGVTNASNVGTAGIGLFKQLSLGVLQFKNLVQGANVSLTDDGLGNVTIAASGGSSAGAPFYHTLTSSDITNKGFLLPITPVIPANVVFDIPSGAPQTYGNDFGVGAVYGAAGNFLTWAGLGLDDGTMAVGMNVRVLFF